MVIVPKSNFEWKLDMQVYNWKYLNTKQERVKFIESLTDDLLKNLYIWRLGFKVPDSKNDQIKDLLKSKVYSYELKGLEL